MNFLRIKPLTIKKLKRFRAIRRGYVSFLLFCFLLLVSFWGVGEYFVNSRALVVKYQGQIYFPTHGAFHPGTDFGFDYEYETNYRDLKGKFAEDPDSENWVLLPIVPYNAYENDFVEGEYGPSRRISSVVISWGQTTLGGIFWHDYFTDFVMRLGLPWHTC